MRQVFLYIIIFLRMILCNTAPEQKSGDVKQSAIHPIDTSDMTNNFYDNTETYSLPVKDLTVDGEIANPGKVDLSDLQKHSVIVKETLIDSLGGASFVGAYRYDGYSLFDILDKKILKKANSAGFKPIIDLYVEIENDKGEKVVFSWGEIYYPNTLHKIILATSVSRIVPSKTRELWLLPVVSKIVAANDLVTERNISSPVKITVKSFPKSFTVHQGLSPMYSADIKLYSHNKPLDVLAPDEEENITFNTVFYGRGKGIHSTSPFKGMLLKDVIGNYYPVTLANLQTGIMCITGKDGYRCAVSYSELFNRNDQQEFLLVRTEPDEDGGLYRLFATPDFFSDRAIKSVMEIHLGY